MMIGQLGWEKIDLIRGLKHLEVMVLAACLCYENRDSINQWTFLNATK